MPGESDRTLAILAWHKIGSPPKEGWETWNYVAEDIFAAQLTRIADLGFQVIDCDTFLQGLVDPDGLPQKAALLTFDDGYASMLSVAQPCLERFGHPSVLFVPTDYVGDSNRFDQENEPNEPICSWDQLRELQRRGVAIQSHSVSHRTFSSLGLEAQTEELARSKIILEDQLGAPVQTFAFPYGDRGTSDDTDRILRELGYRAALLYKGGPVRLAGCNPYRLTRVAVGPDTNLARHLEEVA